MQNLFKTRRDLAFKQYNKEIPDILGDQGYPPKNEPSYETLKSK